MCNNNLYKYLIAILSGIAGIVTGVLFSRGTLTNIVTIIPYFAVISAVILGIFIVLLIVPLNKKRALSKCLCEYGGLIVGAAILNIAAILFALTITLAVTSILSIVVIGIIGALLTAVLSGFLFFIYCIINKKCGCQNNNCKCQQCCCYNGNNNNLNQDVCGFDLE